MARKNNNRGSGLKRKLDLLLGCPLLILVGCVRKIRWCVKSDTGCGPLGIIRTAAIGDTVLISGLLVDARRRYPTRKLVVFLGETNLALGPLLPTECEVVAISVKSPMSSVFIIRKYKLEVAIDLGPWPRIDALLACCSGAGIVAGFLTPGQFRHFGFDRTVVHRSDVHEVVNYRALASTVGVTGDAPPVLLAPELPPSFSFNGSWIALHPWPGGFRSILREWPLSNWVELATKLHQAGHSVAITGGPIDQPRVLELTQDLRKVLPSIHIIELKTRSLAELAAVLKTARGMVSVNTGIMHMAAALDVPTVSLNGPTSTLRWGPIGPRTRSVEPRGGGGGYLHLGFEYSDSCDLTCMKRVHVDDVMGALQSLGVV